MDVSLADPLDRANEASERFLQDALIKHKSRASAISPKGSCYGCNEPGITGLFCDAECGEIYEQLKRNGKL